MAKEYSSEDLAWRAFWITMAGIAAWIVASFVFVILQR
jgi:hypothetical protein